MVLFISKLIERETTRIKDAPEEVRRDWQREFVLISEIFEGIRRIKNVMEKALDDISVIRKGIEGGLRQMIVRKVDTLDPFEKDRGKTNGIIENLVETQKLRKQLVPEMSIKVEEVTKTLEQEKIYAKQEEDLILIS